MEITFKGKSNDFSSSFTKLESNFDMDLNNYENFVELFSMIGYYSYTIVNKKRLTYELKDEKYTYSIMVDNIEGLGGFAEFELLCNSDDYDFKSLYPSIDFIGLSVTPLIIIHFTLFILQTFKTA